MIRAVLDASHSIFFITAVSGASLVRDRMVRLNF